MKTNTKLYVLIESCIRKQEHYITFAEDVYEQDIKIAVRWIMRNNPDIFWFAYQYNYDKVKRKITFRYVFSKERVSQIQKSIAEVIEKDFHIDYVKKLSQIDQVQYIYRWLVSYCNYNVNSAYNQSIYSVFVRRNSVCTGYAKATQYLLGLLKIESKLVFGCLNNTPKESRHCWNIIRIGDIYYHLDTCFADAVLDDLAINSGVSDLCKTDGINYCFFCVSTNRIISTRTIEDLDTLPSCNVSIEPSVIKSLSSSTIIKFRDDIKGCLLSGIGSSADIHLCLSDKNYVLKIFRAKDNVACKKEYHFMRQTKGCQYLIQCNESLTDLSKGILAIEQSTPILDLFCSNYYRITMKNLFKMIKDVSFGWKECQKRGVLYRDIHICNIYRTNNGIYKLGDFGSCTNNFATKEVVGNQWFMAPETLTRGVFSESSAVYSISMVMYFVLNNFRPVFWDGTSLAQQALQKKIEGNKVNLPSSCECFSNKTIVALEEFFKNTLALQPQDRWSSIEKLVLEIKKIDESLEGSDIQIYKNGIDLHLSIIESIDTIENLSHFPTVNIIEESSSTELANMDNYDDFFDYNEDGCDASLEDDDDSYSKDLYIDDIEEFARTNGFADLSKVVIPTESARKKCTLGNKVVSYQPSPTMLSTTDVTSKTTKTSFFKKLFLKKEKLDNVFASIFAPAEISPKSHMLVQVFLHLYQETEMVKTLAKEADKNSERRNYQPLGMKLKSGDKVNVEFAIYSDKLLIRESKIISWQRSFSKCTFDYFLPKNINVSNLSCEVNLCVNGALIGEMRFITQIKAAPKNIHSNILSKAFKHIFISYAHQDAEQIKNLALAYKAQGVDYFFDRDKLKAGDVYEEHIFEYINSADLFILCWSKNAEKSEYVAKEKSFALSRAYPQVSQEYATLKIYPISIKPRAELPEDMKEIYNFEEI